MLKPGDRVKFHCWTFYYDTKIFYIVTDVEDASWLKRVFNGYRVKIRKEDYGAVEEITWDGMLEVCKASKPKKQPKPIKWQGEGYWG